MAFTHLHFHTSYSFLDGCNPIDRAVSRVKELGMTSCAITDHNTLGGIPVWQEECKKQGIKGILGCEGYWNTSMKEAAKPIAQRKEEALARAIAADVTSETAAKKLKVKELNALIEPYMHDMRQFHILYLAKDLEGWHNLVKLQSEAARLCTYNGRYLADMDLLRKYHKGIICTNACIASYSSRMMQEGRKDLAEAYILEMQDIFGDDFYLEIQPLDIEKQHKTNLFYMEMAKKHGIEVIATNDVHYTRKEDADDHDTLLCVGMGKSKADPNRLHYSLDFWIKSEEEMAASFEAQSRTMSADDEYDKLWKKAIANTEKVAEKCSGNIKLSSDKPLFPSVKVPAGRTPESHLTLLSWEGLYKYLAAHPECDRTAYESRLKEELSIINPKGFAPYMLTVREYINWSDRNGIVTGPGRGSAAGSLCLFCIGITKNIDPIKQNLIFSRFLTADRRDPPDIDSDFQWERRGEVIQHLKDYYGEDHVAHIGTYSQMGVKSGLKDVCRVLDLPFKESNNITSMIDEINDSPSTKFKDFDAMKDGDENERRAWEKFDALEKKYPEIFRLARAFEGTPRNQGVHASGVLVMPIPVTDMFPVRYKDGVAIALWTGPQLEQCRSIKCDILGLKTLDIIQKTISFIPGIKNIRDLYRKVDPEDKKVWQYISSKETDAVFQIESGMMKGIVDEVKPTCFNDLGAIVALGRPGPLGLGAPTLYAKAKSGKAEITYPIHGCEDIFGETYGIPIYQEQLMAVSKKIAGFDDMQADSLTRKVLGKKKVEMMPMLKRCHIYGKKNCKGPAGWESDIHAPWYDPEEKYGGEIPGAISNGYTEQEVLDYFDKIEAFASYSFNRAHSACYAYVGLLTAWLKFYYPEQFMAAVLTMTDDDKKAFYISVCDKMGVHVTVPDINISKKDFTPDPESHRILYGLSSVKGVGDTSIPELIQNAPYKNIADAFSRIPKKAFNKRVAESLIKSGAFDWENDNRVVLLNTLHELRGDKIKNEETGEKELVRADPETWSKKLSMQYEDETLGAHITHKTWWENLGVNEAASFVGEIKSVREHQQKDGKLMAFVMMRDTEEDIDIECCVFARQYGPLNTLLFGREGHVIRVNGKKSNKGSFIVNDIEPVRAA